MNAFSKLGLENKFLNVIKEYLCIEEIHLENNI